MEVKRTRINMNANTCKRFENSLGKTVCLEFGPPVKGKGPTI